MPLTLRRTALQVFSDVKPQDKHSMFFLSVEFTDIVGEIRLFKK